MDEIKGKHAGLWKSRGGRHAGGGSVEGGTPVEAGRTLRIPESELWGSSLLQKHHLSIFAHLGENSE